MNRAEIDSPDFFAGAEASSESISEANAIVGRSNTAGTAAYRSIHLRGLREGDEGGAQISYKEAVERHPTLIQKLQGEGTINENAAKQMDEWVLELQNAEETLARSPKGIFGTLRNFGQQSLETLKDPLELSIGAVTGAVAALATPVAVGGFAAAAIFAAETAVQNSISEALVYKSKNDIGLNYSVNEAMTNVLAGTVLMGAIHGVGKGIKFLGSSDTLAKQKYLQDQVNSGRIADLSIPDARIKSDLVINAPEKAIIERHVGEGFIKEGDDLQQVLKRVRDDEAITPEQHKAILTELDRNPEFDSRRLYLDSDDPKPVLPDEDLVKMDAYNKDPANAILTDTDVAPKIQAGVDAVKGGNEKILADLDNEINEIALAHKERLEASGGKLGDEKVKLVDNVLKEANTGLDVVKIGQRFADCQYGV